VDVSPSNGGTVAVGETTPSFYPTTSTFDNGVSVRLEAMPAAGYRFSHWSGDLSGADNPTVVVMDCNKEITANFSSVGTNWWLALGAIAGATVIAVIVGLMLRRLFPQSVQS
jgi:hypothetical protein